MMSGVILVLGLAASVAALSPMPPCQSPQYPCTPQWPTWNPCGGGGNNVIPWYPGGSGCTPYYDTPYYTHHTPSPSVPTMYPYASAQHTYNTGPQPYSGNAFQYQYSAPVQAGPSVRSAYTASPQSAYQHTASPQTPSQYSYYPQYYASANSASPSQPATSTLSHMYASYFPYGSQTATSRAVRKKRSVTFASKQPPPPSRLSLEAVQHLPTARSSHEAEQPRPTSRSSPEDQQLSATTNTSLNNTHPQKVEVSVVFSTGGSYTHDFFTQQLYPAVHALSTHLTLDLLPHLEGGCQSGSSECVGGWLVMCATEVLPIPALHLAFSACLVKDTFGLQAENYPVVMNAAKMCMGTYSVLNWMQMSACVSSGRGEQLFHAAAERLNSLVSSPQDTPIVAFNQEVVIADADSLGLFPSLLCHQLSHIPEAVTFCPNNSQLD